MKEDAALSGANFAVILGDLAYADCDQPRWDTFGVMIEPLASGMPLMVGGAGNHEIEYINDVTPIFEAFEKRYFMPAVKPADGQSPAGIQWGELDDDAEGRSCTPSEARSNYKWGNAFYSVNDGPLHLVALSCYSKADQYSDQYTWVRDDLATVDRSVTPWVIVTMHCPWYSTNTHHLSEWQAHDMQESLEPVFMQYGVDLVLSGHVHAYQRSHPVYKGEVVADGSKAPVYVVLGDGGNREGHALGCGRPSLA